MRKNASIYWSGKRCHNQSEMRIIDARFIVRDANGQALAYVYFGQRSGLLDVIRLWSSF